MSCWRTDLRSGYVSARPYGRLLLDFAQCRRGYKGTHLLDPGSTTIGSKRVTLLEKAKLQASRPPYALFLQNLAKQMVHGVEVEEQEQEQDEHRRGGELLQVSATR